MSIYWLTRNLLVNIAYINQPSQPRVCGQSSSKKRTISSIFIRFDHVNIAAVSDFLRYVGFTVKSMQNSPKLSCVDIFTWPVTISSPQITTSLTFRSVKT